MPRKTRPTPKPVVSSMEDGGYIVTKTHDVEAARDAILTWLQTDLMMGDEEALEELEPVLDMEPEARSGRWQRSGDSDQMWWHDYPLGGRGVTKALVWAW